MALALRTSAPFRTRAVGVSPRVRISTRVVCQAQKPEDEQRSNKAALPMAALVASALLTGALIPEEALAAKSGGRVGGSNFRSRATTTTRVETRTYAAPRVTNNVVIAPGIPAPAVYGGYGYGSPFGFSFMPTFFMPFPFFGGILQLFLLVTVVSVVFNVVRNVIGSGNKNKGDDGWGDL